MKIFICTSKYNYDKVASVRERLEAAGHAVTLPNSYEEPMKEEEMKRVGSASGVESRYAKAPGRQGVGK